MSGPIFPQGRTRVSDDVERELKLVPHDPALLDRLAARTELGELVVVGQRHELQRNSFFDTASRTLGSARVGFRRRIVDGQSLATWSLKSSAAVFRGIATRREIEVHLDPDVAPVLALGTLRQAARQRGAAALAEEIGDALIGGDLPLATPFLEMQTDRTILDLESPTHGWMVELALDRVRLLGHEYAEIEIEAELKRGDEAALESVRHAVEALGPVRESNGSKLGRAMAHLAACHCATN
jgi:inorganic triphosphatase YgiF